MTNSPPTIKTPSSALLILSHSPVHTDTHTNLLPPKLTKSYHSYSINPLTLTKILLRTVSAADHVTCHLWIPSSQNEAPCLHRLSAPRLASRAHKRGPSPFTWVSPGPSPAKTPVGDQQSPMHGIPI
ncbi:hypothetical protein J3E69DRAFT_325114 [Trichoderma sp. SZMC 28015]